MRRARARFAPVALFGMLTVVAMAAASGVTDQAGAAERTLTVAIDANPSSLDIQDAQTFLTGLVLGIHVYDRLFEQSPTGLKPMLAERWETSADGRAWTFHLRRGVKFHDGTPFNATAVKENIERVVNPDSQAPAGEQVGGRDGSHRRQRAHGADHHEPAAGGTAGQPVAPGGRQHAEPDRRKGRQVPGRDRPVQARRVRPRRAARARRQQGLLGRRPGDRPARFSGDPGGADAPRAAPVRARPT